MNQDKGFIEKTKEKAGEAADATRDAARNAKEKASDMASNARDNTKDAFNKAGTFTFDDSFFFTMVSIYSEHS